MRRAPRSGALLCVGRKGDDVGLSLGDQGGVPARGVNRLYKNIKEAELIFSTVSLHYRRQILCKSKPPPPPVFIGVRRLLEIDSFHFGLSVGVVDEANETKKKKKKKEKIKKKRNKNTKIKSKGIKDKTNGKKQMDDGGGEEKIERTRRGILKRYRIV